MQQKIDNLTQKPSGLSADKLSCELVWKSDFPSSLSSIFLSFDSKYVSAVSCNGELSFFDAIDGSLKYRLDISFPLICSQIDDTTREAFVFGKNGVARVSASGQLLWRKNIKTPIINGVVSQYLKNFMICYEGNKIVIADYNAVPKYKGTIDSKGPISSVYASKNSENYALVTSAGDVFYLRYDGSVLWQFCINDNLSSVSMSKDGRVVFIGSSDNKVLCLHSEQKVLFNYALKSSVVCTDISEDGKYFAVGCSDGSVYVLNESGGTVFYDKPVGSVSKIFLTDNAQSILTLSDNRLITMYKICEKKSVEKCSNDMAAYIELDGAKINFTDGSLLKNKVAEDNEKYIEF